MMHATIVGYVRVDFVLCDRTEVVERREERRYDIAPMTAGCLLSSPMRTYPFRSRI